jgi:hypothetical protein
VAPQKERLSLSFLFLLMRLAEQTTFVVYFEIVADVCVQAHTSAQFQKPSAQLCFAY